MFFEPWPAGERRASRGLPQLPPWSGPSPLETGAVVTVERTVARSANVVVAVPTIRAFGSGCMLDVEVVCRQGTLSEDDWWDLFMSVHGGYSGSQDGRLPDKLLRLGVRYGDGAKATTLDQYDRRTPASDEPPAGPLLTHWPGHGGMHGRELGFSGFGLWLWPLPPAEAVEFAVEWPFGGIELTMAELDGAAIVAAAGRSGSYWPDSGPGQ